MSVRLDTARRITGALLAALLVTALVVPVCTALACFDAPMSEHGMMGGMSPLECLDAATTPAGLLASGSSLLVAAMSVAMALGLALMAAFSSPLATLGRLLASTATGPPPPLSPQGVRLLA